MFNLSLFLTFFLFTYAHSHTQHSLTSGSHICDLDNDITTKGLSLQPSFSEVNIPIEGIYRFHKMTAIWGELEATDQSTKGTLCITTCSSRHLNLWVTAAAGEPISACLDFPACLKA